jgi:hypothetical protein
VNRVCLIVEGAGNDKAAKSQLVKALTDLLVNAGFKGRMPRIIPAGGRDQALQDFKATLSQRQRQGFPLLLIDAEDPISSKDFSIDAPIWHHLKQRDGWEKPQGAENNQVALMVTSMETWLLADTAALRKFFGPNLKEKLLPPLANLESRNRKDVLTALEKATEDCGKNRAYRKGTKSFQLLATVNPQALQQHLPHFQRFVEVLQHHLV